MTFIMRLVALLLLVPACASQGALKDEDDFSGCKLAGVALKAPVTLYLKEDKKLGIISCSKKTESMPRCFWYEEGWVKRKCPDSPPAIVPIWKEVVAALAGNGEADPKKIAKQQKKDDKAQKKAVKKEEKLAKKQAPSTVGA